jgi:Flp pilus assembly protein TadD
MATEMKVSAIRCAAVIVFTLTGLGACATTTAPSDAVPPTLTSTDLMASAERLERVGDFNAELHYRVARVHVALGNPRVAQEAYMRALGLDPDHVAALEGYGLLLLQMGQTDAAEQVLKRAEEKNPESWRVANGLGAIADLKGNHEQAQSLFRFALQFKPDDPELLNNLGFSLYQSGNYATAVINLQRAIEISPSYPNAWSNLGLLYARRGEYDRSVAAFEHIMDAASARYSTAYACIGNHKYSEAEKLLQAAIKTSPAYYAAAHTALKHVRAEQSERRSVAGD